ncbi:MAG: S8 family serine peptidase [Desulfitobacteriaceae bacterium]
MDGYDKKSTDYIRGKDVFEKVVRGNKLEKLCQEAIRKNIYLVAAGNCKNRFSLPSNLNKVTKVLPGVILDSRKLFYYYEDYIAQGIPQMVPWLKDRYALMAGSSFAVPHVSARLANIIEENGRLPYNEIIELLRKSAHQIKNLNLTRITLLKRQAEITTQDDNLYNIVSRSIENEIKKELDEKKPLWEEGLNRFNCFDVITNIEKELDIRLNYSKFNLFDFYSAATLANKVRITTEK